MKTAKETGRSLRAWHTLRADEAIGLLASNRDAGLTQEEADARLSRQGPNRLPQPKRPSALLRFLLQFHNVLIYILLVSAAGAFFLADWVDAGVILGVVLINAVIGFIQEDKAENALAAIRDMLSLSATVLRDGRKAGIDAEALVPGDLVMVQSGDKVPADLRLLETRNLSINEAALTGESAPSVKAVGPVDRDAVLGDRLCMAYSGTLVTSGQGLGVVAATGGDTEIGRISSLLSEVQTPETPLQRQLASFGHWLTVVILLMSAGIFLFGLLVREVVWEKMFMAVVGIAVAAVPEGLPVIVTITLAVGVQRMARRNAIIRQLPAVEALGAVTVICTDKTGTLTRNEMAVSGVVAGGDSFTVAGTGYDPVGTIEHEGRAVSAAEVPAVQAVARAVMLCNDAVLDPAERGFVLHGDPTEGALLAFACRAGLDPEVERRNLPRKDVVPFESEHRFMATLHADSEGGGCVFLKGAPEAVLERCDRARIDGADRELDHAYWSRRIDELASRGQRVLAVAMKMLENAPVSVASVHVGSGFVLLGLCGLMDPPREEARESVARCHDAGIRVKMITGDHVLTACAIGDRLQIGDGATALTGAEIEALDDGGLTAAARTVDIFARTSPEHKLRLVDALQRAGDIVAMTGDGVNDAPALKRADVGVAMGRKGTEAAKEAAAMVLADDNFASIAHAVEEGRTIHDNVRKALVYILPVSFGQAGGIMIGILLGLTLPITPLQILWVNMVTAVTLCLTLAFEPPEDESMQRPPRDPGAPLLNWFFIWRVVFVSCLLVAGLLGGFLFEMHRGMAIEVARTAAVNALVVGEIFYLFNSRFIIGSALSKRSLKGNRYVPLAVIGLVGLQLLFSYLPAMQTLFGTADIDAGIWGRIVAFGAALFLIVELEKWAVRILVVRRKRKADRRRSLARFAWLSIGAAVLTIGLKAAAFYLTGSVGLLSDALESLVNLAAAVMALAMLLVAARPPDRNHHFGHSKAEYFSSGMEGALIIMAALGIAVTAYERLVHPRMLESLDVGLLISAAAALVNLIVARVLLRVGKRYRSITLEADAKHLMTDVWTSVGVIGGLGAVHFTGLQILDPMIALLVAFNILWSGIILMRRSASGLLDETLPEEENACIEAVLGRYRAEGVEFHDLRTRQSGAHRFMNIHVLVAGDLTVKAGHDLVERIEGDIRQAVGEITILTHLEPLDDPSSFAHEHSPRRIGSER
ncbi:MAG: carbonate dehydratase [Proteobacteria bacterium]|nr:carbonate dehydratase [Pseudomonadota bacterium]